MRAWGLALAGAFLIIAGSLVSQMGFGEGRWVGSNMLPKASRLNPATCRAPASRAAGPIDGPGRAVTGEPMTDSARSRRSSVSSTGVVASIVSTLMRINSATECPSIAASCFSFRACSSVS